MANIKTFPEDNAYNILQTPKKVSPTMHSFLGLRSVSTAMIMAKAVIAQNVVSMANDCHT